MEQLQAALSLHSASSAYICIIGVFACTSKAGTRAHQGPNHTVSRRGRSLGSYGEMPQERSLFIFVLIWKKELKAMKQKSAAARGSAILSGGLAVPRTGQSSRYSPGETQNFSCPMTRPTREPRDARFVSARKLGHPASGVRKHGALFQAGSPASPGRYRPVTRLLTEPRRWERGYTLQKTTKAARPSGLSRSSAVRRRGRRGEGARGPEV